MDAQQLVSWTGATVIAYYSLKLSLALLRYAKAFMLGPAVDLKSFGRYACVTGGTDGIGRAYAVELASRGINLIIISRSPNKLDELATSIMNRYKVDVQAIAADFTSPDIYSSLAAKLAEFDIGILVNNVGMSGTGVGPRYYSEYDIDRIGQTINCNMLSVLMMTRIILPKFLEKSKGLVINISSTAANIPPCLSSVYSSTKKAMQVFSSTLQQETAAICPGIYVQDVAPCFVATKLSNQQKVPFHVPDTTEYVRSAVNTIGNLDMTAGYFPHEIEATLMAVVPRWLLTRVLFNTKKQIRELDLKKAQQCLS